MTDRITALRALGSKADVRSPAAEALREAGYVKLRPLWVPIAVRDQVETSAEKYINHINWIKANARNK